MTIWYYKQYENLPLFTLDYEIHAAKLPQPCNAMPTKKKN